MGETISLFFELGGAGYRLYRVCRLFLRGVEATCQCQASGTPIAE